MIIQVYSTVNVKLTDTKKSMLHNEIKIRVTNYHIHRFKWPSLNKLS